MHYKWRKQPTFKYAIEGWLFFFLLKSLYYQLLFVSLQHENPPSLSTMLKCAGRFCFYGYMATRIPFIKTYSTPHEAFPLLCSWPAVESLRSSYTVKTKAYSYALLCIYVCPTSAHRGFRYGYRRNKSNTFTLKTT